MILQGLVPLCIWLSEHFPILWCASAGGAGPSVCCSTAACQAAAVIHLVLFLRAAYDWSPGGCTKAMAAHAAASFCPVVFWEKVCSAAQQLIVLHDIGLVGLEHIVHLGPL